MNQFEEHIQSDLHAYLLSMNEIEKRLPKNEDIEEKWQSIAEAYLPDGMSEDKSTVIVFKRPLTLNIAVKNETISIDISINISHESGNGCNTCGII